jgi:hypothetical protein
MGVHHTVTKIRMVDLKPGDVYYTHKILYLVVNNETFYDIDRTLHCIQSLSSDGITHEFMSEIWRADYDNDSVYVL